MAKVTYNRFFWMPTMCSTRVSELDGGSGCTVCQRACSTCRLQTSLQWARPASAASAPIRTRPRTLPPKRTWFCHIKKKQECWIHRVVTIQINVAIHEIYFFILWLWAPKAIFTCMIMNSNMRGSWLMSPGGRSNRKEVFHTEQDPPLVSLLLITTPSWCKLITTWYSAHRNTKCEKNLSYTVLYCIIIRSVSNSNLVLTSVDTPQIQKYVFSFLISSLCISYLYLKHSHQKVEMLKNEAHCPVTKTG